VQVNERMRAGKVWGEMKRLIATENYSSKRIK